MRFKLLNEGINDVKKYYPTISDEDFNKIIDADPTSNKEKDKAGKYSKWLLNLYKNNELKLEDLYKATEYLTKFDTLKNRFSNKDINQFKNLPDLFKQLKEVEEQELTPEEKSKQLRKDAHKIGKDIQKEAKKIFEDSKWEVWQPLTHAADCSLGANTQWCTATREDDYYWTQYSKQGPLYIFINKNDPNKKYQLHIKSGSFMDRYDDSVSLGDFYKENNSLKNLIIQFLKEGDPSIKSWLDEGIIKISTKDFARVVYDSQSGRDKLPQSFIEAVIYDDLFVEFIDYTSTGPDSIIPELSQENKDLLKKKFNIELPPNITLGELETIVEENELDTDDLYDAFLTSMADAEIMGAVNDCTSDFDMEMIDVFGKGNWNITEDEVTLKMAKETIINCVLISWEENEGDYNWVLSTLLKTSRFNFREPYNGWYGFDEKSFDEYLTNALLQI